MNLYYSKQIIDKHHGEMAIRSVEHKGTTITIRIPRKLLFKGIRPSAF